MVNEQLANINNAQMLRMSQASGAKHPSVKHPSWRPEHYVAQQAKAAREAELNRRMFDQIEETRQILARREKEVSDG